MKLQSPRDCVASMYALIRNQSPPIIADTLLLVFVVGMGVTILARNTSGHDFHRANIEVSGKINGKNFLLFADTRLQNHMANAVLLNLEPYIIDIQLTPNGHQNVKVNFSYVDSDREKISAQTILSARCKRAFNLPLNGAGSHTHLTVRLITNE
ncbi:hypothetical protein HAP94_05140 [Acidithiobacillus ferrivorans]|nr:hypothetical protein [Acidithiobacillus ferrivorans]